MRHTWGAQGTFILISYPMQLVVIQCCVIQAEWLHCLNACSLSPWVKMIQMIKFLSNYQHILYQECFRIRIALVLLGCITHILEKMKKPDCFTHEYEILQNSQIQFINHEQFSPCVAAHLTMFLVKNITLHVKVMLTEPTYTISADLCQVSWCGSDKIGLNQ